MLKNENQTAHVVRDKLTNEQLCPQNDRIKAKRKLQQNINQQSLWGNHRTMKIQCDNFRSFNNNARICMTWEHRNGELDTQRMQIKLKNSCIYILPIGPGPWPLNVTRSHQQSQQSSILTDLIRVCPGLLWFRQDFANVFGIRKLELWTTRWWKDFVSFGTVHECDGRMDERTDSKELEIISALILSPIRRDAVNPYALEWWLWFEIGIASRSAIGLTVQLYNCRISCLPAGQPNVTQPMTFAPFLFAPEFEIFVTVTLCMLQIELLTDWLIHRSIDQLIEYD